MDNEIWYLLIGGGLSLIGVIVAECLRLVIDNKLSKKNTRREYIYKIYDKKIEAHQELYTKLVRYRNLFVETSDIIFINDIKPFDYKDECERLKNFFLEHEVYFNVELSHVLKIILVNNLNVVKYLSPYVEPGNNQINQPIIEHSADTINRIEACLKIIKDELKMKEIDKAFK